MTAPSRSGSLDSGRLLHTLEGHASFVRAVALTPDGKRAVSASDDRTLKIWELDSGRLLHTLEGQLEDEVPAVASDGERAISASHDRTLKIWELRLRAASYAHSQGMRPLCGRWP